MTQQAIETANTEKPAEPAVQLVPQYADGALVMARGSGQLIFNVPREMTLEGLELRGGPNGEPCPPGVRVLRVAIGPRVYPANMNGMDVGRWEDALGQVAPGQSFLVISIYNDGADPVPVTALLTMGIKRGAGVGAAVSPSQTSGGTASFPVPLNASPQPALPANLPRAGANEVWVPLTRESVRRLREAITGGTPISIYEQGDLVRRLEAAMRQP